MYTLFAKFRAVLVVTSVCVTPSPPGISLQGAPPEIRTGRLGPAVPASAAADRKEPRRGLRRSVHDNIPPTPFVIRNHAERSADEIRPPPPRFRDPPYPIGGVLGRSRRTMRRTAGKAARSVFRRGACRREKPASRFPKGCRAPRSWRPTKRS